MLKAVPIAALLNVLVSWFGGDSPAPAPAYPLVTTPVLTPSHAIEIPDAAVDTPLIPVGPMFDMVNLSYSDRENFFVVTTSDFARIDLMDENLVVVQATRHMLLVSFSGTQRIAQWKTNFKCVSSTCNTNPRALRVALEAVFKILLWMSIHPAHTRKPILLCGHSLGGALARLVAMILQSLKGNAHSPSITELYSIAKVSPSRVLQRYAKEYPAWVITFTVSAPLFVNERWPTGPITEISLTGDWVGHFKAGFLMDYFFKSKCALREKMVWIASKHTLLDAHKLENVLACMVRKFGPNMPAPNGATVHQAKTTVLALKELNY